MKFISRLGVTAAMAVASTLAIAQHHEHGATMHTAATTEAAAADMSEGEIRKVNKDAGKLTIRHGELKNLGMPPMTMIFQVKDPAMLDQVKPGDKIRFVADKTGGKFTVMQLEVLK